MEVGCRVRWFTASTMTLQHQLCSTVPSILQNVKIVLVPTYIKYRNSKIRNSNSDFSTGTTFFSAVFPMEFCGIPESEAEIPIPDPPARGAVPAEFPTKRHS